MNGTAFDTLKAAKGLRDAGFDGAQAEAVVATVGDAVQGHTTRLASSIETIAENMATKEYVATIAENMATKEYVATIADNMATKEYVATIAENMATKEYVATIADNMATTEYVATIAENMATKEYVATIADNMATKEYVAAAISELRAEIAVEFKTLYRHLWVMGTSIVGVTVVLVKLLP